jgi:hypothetical protein
VLSYSTVKTLHGDRLDVWAPRAQGDAQSEHPKVSPKPHTEDCLRDTASNQLHCIEQQHEANNCSSKSKYAKCHHEHSTPSTSEPAAMQSTNVFRVSRQGSSSSSSIVSGDFKSCKPGSTLILIDGFIDSDSVLGTIPLLTPGKRHEAQQSINEWLSKGGAFI